jgi:hypothetical protein
MLHGYTTEVPNSSSTLLHQYVQHKEYTEPTTLTQGDFKNCKNTLAIIEKQKKTHLK